MCSMEGSEEYKRCLSWEQKDNEQVNTDVYIAATFTEANVILLKEKLVARKKLQMIKKYRVLEYLHYGSMLRCRFSFGS